jgi:hypothetical protein
VGQTPESRANFQYTAVKQELDRARNAGGMVLLSGGYGLYHLVLTLTTRLSLKGKQPPGMRCEPLCCITEHGHPLRHQTKLVADGGRSALTAFLSETVNMVAFLYKSHL